MQASLPLKLHGFLIRRLVFVVLMAVLFSQVGLAASTGFYALRMGRSIGFALCVALIGLIWLERQHALDRRKAQEADKRFIAVAEGSLDAFVLLDAVYASGGKIQDLRFRYANAKAQEMLRLTRERVLGRLLQEVLPQSSRTGFFERCCQVVESGHSRDEELKIEDEQIDASWVRAHIAKLGDGVAITIVNLSQTKAIQRRYEELENLSDSIFESAPFSIIATDASGTITAMNRAAEFLSQYKRGELVGRISLTSLYDPAELSIRAKELSYGQTEPIAPFSVLTNNLTENTTGEREWTFVRKDGTRTPVSLALRPLRSGSGEINGYFSIVSDITDRRQMLTYVTHLATHDPLTGLVGRIMLRERLQEAVEHAKETARRVAVFIMDLDHFKRVNDSLGYQAGDQVIREAAQQLRSAVRSTDIVGRMGGDEFVVVLTDIQTVEDIDRFALSLVHRISRTMTVNQYELNVTASLGVCIYPDFANDADSLLERADAAMYESKESGRNQHQIFNSAMLKESSKRLRMEHELRYALQNDEFSLVYQPQVCMRTGNVVGLEALLRWENARLGKVSPAEFIPLAEETGLIVPIGEWIFRRACLEGKNIGDAIGRELSVAINLSPRQFRQKNLLEVIEGALLESGLNARNLEIEITENTLMINSAANLEMLQKFRELGGRIAIDDFGTGFCSFSYLLEYHVDRLKIDQSFVRRAVVDSNAAAVVRTILAMSHGLNIKVVAEGVETAEQLRFLRRRRCDEAQGYLFARPMPAEEFPAAIEKIGLAWQEIINKFDVDDRRLLHANTVPQRYFEVCKEPLIPANEKKNEARKSMVTSNP